MLSSNDYLKATDSYIDLTAAFVWTVKHLEHPICLYDGTSPVSLGMDAASSKVTKFQDAENNNNKVILCTYGYVRGYVVRYDNIRL